MTTLDQRRALALRIAKTIGRDPASIVAALRSRLDSYKFNPHEKRDTHGRWTEGGPSLPDLPKGKGSGSRYAENRAINDRGMTPSTEELGPGLGTNPPKPILPGQSKIKTLDEAKEFIKRWDFGGPQWSDMSVGERARTRDLAKSLKKFSPAQSASILKSMDRLDDLIKNPPKAPTGFNPAGMDATTIAFKFNEHEKRDSHGRWTDGGPSIPNVGDYHSKSKSIADSSKAKTIAREARGLEQEDNRYDTDSPLLKGADMTQKIPTNDDGLRVWRLDEVDFDDLVRDGLSPGDEYVVADAYSKPTIDTFDPREHYVGGDYEHLLT